MRRIESILPIILAAGDSVRMGYPKALLPLGDERFVTRVLRIIRDVGLPRPLIVLGRGASMIQSHIRNWPADIKVNPDPDRGQLSSIQLALENVGPDYEAGLIWPVDQPAVSEDLVRRLTQKFLMSQSRIACPTFDGKRGHPAIFHRDIFEAFMEAPLAEGPKKILLKHQQEILELSTEESATVEDIDTPSDYLALTGNTLEEALALL